MIVFLSGPISGNPNYQNDFAQWVQYCATLGIGTINPADMPEGLRLADYMRTSLAQVEAADAILMLPGSDKSRGCEIERLYAEYLQKPVYHAEFRRVFAYGKNGGSWVTRCSIEPFAKLATALGETERRKRGEADDGD